MLELMFANSEASELVPVLFEHTLVSLSKWESVYRKPFFTKEPKTREETLEYIKMMLVSENPPENFIDQILDEHIIKTNNYINEQQTATTIRDDPSQKGSRQIITSELIYSWMILFGVPPEYQHWHVSRLMILIQIRGAQQTPPKKMSRAAQAAEYQRLNAERREALGTRG